jgi:hypothetical protein
MHIAVSSSSLVAAVAASRSLFAMGTNSAVASAVDFAYKSESDLMDENDASMLGDECYFAMSSSLRGHEADAGILGCTDPEYICVEDELSSLGGRCAPIKMMHRDLQDTPACTAKCTGTDACKGLTQDFIDNNIGDKSCCGTNACAYITGDSFIGPDSCLGNKACYKAIDDWHWKLHRR